MTERKIGLGYTEKGYRVVAEIRLDEPTPGKETTFIDHSTGPAPAQLGIMFNVVSPTNRHGQVPAEDRVITRRASNDPGPATDAAINRVWERWHLNDMRAACEHMTEEMLNPADEVLDAYLAEHPERGRYGRLDALQSYRLDHVACPVTGYTWGHSWLAETISDDDLAIIRTLLEKGRVTE